MKRLNQVVRNRRAAVLLFMLMASCAAIPRLKVHYRLPSPSKRLEGMKIVLVVRDRRQVPVIFGKGARGEYENFSGNISMNIVHHDGTGLEMGLYSPADMLREALRRRLENENVTVMPASSRSGPRLEILLKRFVLDLVDRKWVATMAYDARIVRAGRVAATQSVEGQAERLKLLGRREANIVVGEIFTDMVNRLDVSGLLRKAGSPQS